MFALELENPATTPPRTTFTMRPLFVSRSALRSATRASSSRLLPLCQASRFYSAKVGELDASKLSITKTTSPKALSKAEDLVFGREFTGKPPAWPVIINQPCDPG